MNLNQYFSALRKAHDGVLPLDDGQKEALAYEGENPLWIMAGPGTGKTHTLVWLVFKRILVDEVLPESIILTTFTSKASAELESRLILNRQKLIDAGVHAAKEFEITQMKVGTLHGLCSHFLQEQRYEPTLRIRVLEDELTQQFFVRHSRNPLVLSDDRSLWQHFGLSTRPTDQFPPNMAKRTEHACRLFNRITENSIDVEPMLRSGDTHFVLLAQAYKHYQQALYDNHRTDQANLQRHFLNFLATSSGKAWLEEEDFTVLVDEYQDTNLIQEEIYFTLAGATGGLTVVGDDDQSLYRFRGAIVESLIEFDVACQEYLGKYPEKVYLRENRRSHHTIVEWINRFIEYHPEMRDESVRVRVPDKPPLESKSGICGAYPAIMSICERTNLLAAAKMVRIIEEIRADRLIDDYSQIALLTFSTRETPRGIGAFTEALRNARIPIYNPRSHITQMDVRFLAMIGALSTILDPDFDPDALPRRLPRGVPEYISSARQEYTALEESGRFRALEEYVNASVQAVQHSKYDPSSTKNYLTRKGGRRVTISGLLFKLLAHEPFSTDLNDIEGGERLKALNLILADYESIYDDGELKIELVPGTSNMTRIERWTLYDFYSVFIEGIHDDLNDPEDDEVSIQPGVINVMTIHQAKGLEFEVVFVLRPDHQPSLNYTHVLEDLLDPFITRPTKPRHRSQELRAAEDAIRLFFVAYSRAKRLLILTGSSLGEWDRVLGRDMQGNSIHTIRDLGRLGVHRL